MTLQTIDVDQHLFESRTTWSEYIDPAQRADALSIADDDAGWPWLTWRGSRLTPLEVPIPERSALIGEDRLRRLRGERAPASFDELVPDSYRLAGARLASLDAFGLDAAVMFPNYGLLWEQRLASDRDAQRANARAYNRFVADVCGEGEDRLFGVAHVLLHDPGLGGRGDPPGAGTGGPPGHDRPGPGGREAALARGLRSGVGCVQRRGRCTRLPRLGVREPAAPRLADRGARGRRAALRLDLLVPGAGGRPGQPDPERRARAVSPPARRGGRADGELGAELPPAHRRRVGLLHPAPRRAVPHAGGPPVELLPAPGAGGRAPLRDAEPPRPEGRRRHLHARQRLAARRGGGRPDGAGAARRGRPGGYRPGPTSWEPTPPGSWACDASTWRRRRRSGSGCARRTCGNRRTARRRPPAASTTWRCCVPTSSRPSGSTRVSSGSRWSSSSRTGTTRGRPTSSSTSGTTTRWPSSTSRISASGPTPRCSGGFHHLAISVDRAQWDAARTRLDEAGIPTQIESEISLYFSDPDGVRLELIAEDLGSLYGTPLH